MKKTMTSTTSTTRTNNNKNRGMEENALAILDSSGVKDSRDVEDDRLAFLEAVRVATIVPESGISPSSKIYEAIFQIMRNGTSLELTIASYQLLMELDKRFPRVYLTQAEQSKTTTSSSTSSPEHEETWLPFSLGSKRGYNCRNAASGDLGEAIDSSGFSLLTETIAQPAAQINLQLLGTKLLAGMLLFQYLISNFESDFLRRKTAYKESMDWSFLRQSLLNTVLPGSRKDYRSLIDHCLSIILKGSRAGFNLHDEETEEKSSGETVYGCGVALPTTLSQLGKETCIAVQKLMTMIMELDRMKMQADQQGYILRADGVRSPLVDIIVDFLTYNKDLISPFLQVFSESEWKMEIILQYFKKYLPQSSVRTWRSNNSPEDDTLEGVLKYFSSDTSTRSVVRKINSEIAQTLLAHAFQAYLSPVYSVYQNAVSNGEAGDSSLVQICKDIISAFQNIRKIDKRMEMMPIAKEALFTAAVILSTK